MRRERGREEEEGERPSIGYGYIRGPQSVHPGFEKTSGWFIGYFRLLGGGFRGVLGTVLKCFWASKLSETASVMAIIMSWICPMILWSNGKFAGQTPHLVRASGHDSTAKLLSPWAVLMLCHLGHFQNLCPNVSVTSRVQWMHLA